jgi:hypothetical protein
VISCSRSERGLPQARPVGAIPCGRPYWATFLFRDLSVRYCFALGSPALGHVSLQRLVSEVLLCLAVARTGPRFPSETCQLGIALPCGRPHWATFSFRDLSVRYLLCLAVARTGPCLPPRFHPMCPPVVCKIKCVVHSVFEN